MKDCEPRDWPHLRDSRANEQPHRIIPHNASGTKAPTADPRENDGVGGEWGRMGQAERMGKGGGGVQTVKSDCWSVRRQLAHILNVVAKQRSAGQE